MVRVYRAHIALARFDVPTADRIIGLLQTEWGMTEEAELKKAQEMKNKLLAKA